MAILQLSVLQIVSSFKEKENMIIFLRILFFFLGVCGLISFVAMFLEGTVTLKLVDISVSFLVMVLSFFLSFSVSHRMIEYFFTNEPMSRGRKLFLRLCFAVMGGLMLMVFIIKIFVECVTLASLVSVASLFVMALFFFCCTILGKFPIFFADSINRKDYWR